MGEWVLVSALNITSGAPGEICDVSLSTLGCFTRKTTCEAADLTIASRSVAVVGQARSKPGCRATARRQPPY